MQDGRVFDLTGLSMDQILALMAYEQLRPEDIKETRHILDDLQLPGITCPRCGKTSYNKHHSAAERMHPIAWIRPVLANASCDPTSAADGVVDSPIDK